MALGTASLHHIYSAKQRQALLEVAATAGITHFDTSPYYGYGLAETDLGVFLKGQRTAFTVGTKVGLYPWLTESTRATSVWARKAIGKLAPRLSLPVVNWQIAVARTSLRQSLKRLRTDYVDFIFLHEPDGGLIDTDEFTRWIESEYALGVVRSWGLAGVADRVAPWVQTGHPLARVIQTQDSLDKFQASFILNCGRNFQFTYGYLSAQQEAVDQSRAKLIMSRALNRNVGGAIIISTRKTARVTQLARLAS